MNLKKKIQENLLLKSSKISNKDQLESYYNRIRQKLPPILQSKHLFMEQLIHHEVRTNETSQRYKHQALEYQPQKNSLILRNRSENSSSIQNILKLEKYLLKVENSPRSKIQVRVSSLKQKGKIDKTSKCLSAKKINFEPLCLTQKVKRKQYQLIESSYKKTIDINASINKSGNISTKKDRQQNTSSRKHLKTCIFGQQMSLSILDLNYNKSILKQRVQGPLSQRVNLIIDDQKYKQSNVLITLDQKRQSFQSSQNCQPWSQKEQFQEDMLLHFN